MSYGGEINFFPFSSNININLKDLDLKNLVGDEAILTEILKSNIFSNENLNYNLNIRSNDVSNHRKLKDLNLRMNFNRKQFSCALISKGLEGNPTVAICKILKKIGVDFSWNLYI